LGKKEISTEDFYNHVSDFYESMIDFENNLFLRTHAYKGIFPVVGSIADIGCGVGVDSIALALNGHNVKSFDVSPKMIDAVKANAIKYNVKIDANVSSFGSIPKKYNNFNSVVSIGNTIAHLTSKELYSAINRIYKLLRPGGKLFIHILNYELIIKGSKSINNITNRDGKIIIRFYDFGKDEIDFNILSFPIDSPKDFNIVKTKQYPHSKNEIKLSLTNAGFTKIKFMRNIMGEKFNAKTSKDLFISAEKINNNF
jgi:glycine/sarcosine N-methyltransferase